MCYVLTWTYTYFAHKNRNCIPYIFNSIFVWPSSEEQAECEYGGHGFDNTINSMNVRVRITSSFCYEMKWNGNEMKWWNENVYFVLHASIQFSVYRDISFDHFYYIYWTHETKRIWLEESGFLISCQTL